MMMRRKRRSSMDAFAFGAELLEIPRAIFLRSKKSQVMLD